MRFSPLCRTFFLVLAALAAYGLAVNVSSADDHAGDRAAKNQVNGDAATLTPDRLRCEYLRNPTGIDQARPRLSWLVRGEGRSQTQAAYRVMVASTAEKLSQNDADLWDSGVVRSDQTLFVRYDGKPLPSKQTCHWKVAVWAGDPDAGSTATTSEPAMWTMGLLDEQDWTADYISFRDDSPVHKDVDTLRLPPAAQYRREFDAPKTVRRATVYSTALGIYEMHINGQRVGDAYFAPGWTDYRQRAYYDTHDVTDLIRQGNNAIGLWVADGWYSGYVGFGLLTGMGTEKTGRANYGKTPSVMAQLEIEYTDGTVETVNTDPSWKVSTEGPIIEGDLLMGEHYDARREYEGWAETGFDDSQWASAISAAENRRDRSQFYQRRNPTRKGGGVRNLPEDRDLGFTRPKLEAFPGEAVEITEEIPARSVTEREKDQYIFNLGQNFAGVIRLKVKGPAGHAIQIRYGEMLHPDGRLMTENLRKARATDVYICRGDADGEVFQPRFTFHGFQYVELSNFPTETNGIPTTDVVTGLVMHSDTPMTSTFECSDPMVNQLFSNVLWTQRSNFIDLPTDCPQRDERMGWTGDAQAYVATAAYNADIGAFYTKWLRELMESQRPSGAFPGYAPFPFQHGWDFGTAWADAGVICPWTIWQFYGDTQVIEDCWEPMKRFIEWRQSTQVGDLGISHGNAWGDWLSQGSPTPLDYIDTIYSAISHRMMAEMAEATGRQKEAIGYRDARERIERAFVNKYVRDDGSISVNTQTALALALFADLIPEDRKEKSAERLAEMLATNGNHMATGFLGTRPLLPMLSKHGQNDLAVFLLQSREFPSWGYEIANGATTIWERWDSFTKEDGFGRHNAAMNSFSHYAFGAVCEWMFAGLAGIQTDGPGFKNIVIKPSPPRPGSNAMNPAIDWVKASYDSIRGTIVSDWKLDGDRIEMVVEIPANTTAAIHIPTSDLESIRESGKVIGDNPHVKLISHDAETAVLHVGSGRYAFEANTSIRPAEQQLQTSAPEDNTINPDDVEIKGSPLASWDLGSPDDQKAWELVRLNWQRRSSKTLVRPTGEDPQMVVTLDKPVKGPIAVVLRGRPVKGNEVQIFWSGPDSSFNGRDQIGRRLMPNEMVQDYVFLMQTAGPIDSIRVDPFSAVGDEYNRPEMVIESIALYSVEASAAADESETSSDSKKSGEGSGSETDQAGFAPRPPAKSSLPNVLFILAEDQGAQMGLLGTPGLTTPNLDAIAKSGIYFDNAMVAYPVCSASKASIYTGLFGHANGILNNTHNFHKPASAVTAGERAMRLAQINRVVDRHPTLTEILKSEGYVQAVTHKLHVLPNEKFPYDAFLGGAPEEVVDFTRRADQADRPWFVLMNIPYSHRPYPDSDVTPIDVDPAAVQLPGYLPNTPVIRQDWAEYLAGIEKVDDVVGRLMSGLRQGGHLDDTYVIYMSDHGPTYPHGKMTLHDLGLRVPLMFAGPGIPAGVRTDALASGVDFLPTVMDLVGDHADIEWDVDSQSSGDSSSWRESLHGVSLADVIRGKTEKGPRDYVFAEISNRGPLPNDGIQERCVLDGRYKLIVRTNVEQGWRQVNADSRQRKPWGNRTYDETLRLKDQFPMQYRILAEQDPQSLDGTVPPREFYDLKNDPEELQNLIDQPSAEPMIRRLTEALQQWLIRTDDPAVDPAELLSKLSAR